MQRNGEGEGMSIEETVARMDEAYEAATSGEWINYDNDLLHESPTVLAPGSEPSFRIYVCSCATDSEKQGIKDAAFIAEVHNAWPEIKAELERLGQIEAADNDLLESSCDSLPGGKIERPEGYEEDPLSDEQKRELKESLGITDEEAQPLERSKS